MKKLKNKIKKIIYNSNYKLTKCILTESNPDFTDNSRYVFDELINRKINEEYKIIWFVKDKKKFDDIKIKNVIFINRDSNIFNKIRFKYCNYFSKYIIDCNTYIKKRNKNQFRIYLGHAMPLKIPRAYTYEVGETDIFISNSDFFINICKEIYLTQENKIKITGSPRTDVFLSDTVLIENKKNKIIVWMPTYRTPQFYPNKQYEKTFRYGVPCINEYDQLLEINDLLKKYNIDLIIKLHPAEKENEINKIKLSNIEIIKNEIFEKGHHNVYELLNQTDALITDYSSIYYDFLLKDKPIGMAISDIDIYKKHNELLFDDFEKNLPAEYIYNFEDLKKFIKNIGEGKDVKQTERNEKCKLYNKYNDGKSSSRVVDILEKNMKGK